MYRCSICNESSEPRKPMLKHVLYRNVVKSTTRIVGKTKFGTNITETNDRSCREVASELPICVYCHKLLEDGSSYSQLLLRHSTYKTDNSAPPYKKGADKPSKPEMVEVVKIRIPDEVFPDDYQETEFAKVGPIQGAVNKPIRKGIPAKSPNE